MRYDKEEVLGAIARGWCSDKNSHKTMDSDLAYAIYDELEKLFKEDDIKSNFFPFGNRFELLDL